MDRLASQPRPNWQKRVESIGLHHHTLNGERYWDESVCYTFRPSEIDGIEIATQNLHEMCLEVVQQVIDERLFGLFFVPHEFEEMVLRSWDADEAGIYGRFDLAYDGHGSPRMLEYNADTPTALVEASVAQWYWLQDTDPRAADDGMQFNLIHERLIDAWKALREHDRSPIHFSALSGVVEDYVTVEYLRDTAMQAGFQTDYLDVEQIGWNPTQKEFRDVRERPIRRIFKLYPWEFLIRDDFGKFVPQARTRWIEPAWKMILSCKSILPLLWERYPDSPYLVPAAFEPLKGDYIRKPIHGREGSNMQVVRGGKVVLETDGPYGEGPFIYQQLVPIRRFDGFTPILGSWIVNGYACGMGVREGDDLITTNTSRFVPHQMVS